MPLWNRGVLWWGRCMWNGVEKIRKIKRRCGTVYFFYQAFDIVLQSYETIKRSAEKARLALMSWGA